MKINEIGKKYGWYSETIALLQAYLFADDISKDPKQIREIDGTLGKRTFAKIQALDLASLTTTSSSTFGGLPPMPKAPPTRYSAPIDKTYVNIPPVDLLRENAPSS